MPLHPGGELRHLHGRFSPWLLPGDGGGYVDPALAAAWCDGSALHSESDMPTAIAGQELDPERSGLDGNNVTGPQNSSAPRIDDAEHRPVYDDLGDERRIRHHRCNGEQH